MEILSRACSLAHPLLRQLDALGDARPVAQANSVIARDGAAAMARGEEAQHLSGQHSFPSCTAWCGVIAAARGGALSSDEITRRARLFALLAALGGDDTAARWADQDVARGPLASA